ncbi:stage 0 sporulation protein [Clostridia bacterium]|nr:stage 0 sporulation protein [Clostridia bacterium]
MAIVIGVKFRQSGKIYYFDPGDIKVPKGAGVIVQTTRGSEHGTCGMTNTEIPDNKIVQPLRKMLRIATPQDAGLIEANRAREKRAIDLCQQKANDHKLDMKVVDAEYTFDGNKLVFYFTSDGRVDFRELVKSLASEFHTRIELRQIGVRDEAKLLGGLGICGKPFCCSTFLNDFHPVSIKMAKEQNLSLNPVKISGTCGRLMCCLKHEQEAYEDLQRTTPQIGTVVETPVGAGRVTDVSLLRGQIKVRLDAQPDAPPKTFHRDELQFAPPTSCARTRRPSAKRPPSGERPQ